MSKTDSSFLFFPSPALLPKGAPVHPGIRGTFRPAAAHYQAQQREASPEREMRRHKDLLGERDRSIDYTPGKVRDPRSGWQAMCTDPSRSSKQYHATVRVHLCMRVVAARESPCESSAKCAACVRFSFSPPFLHPRLTR